MSSPILSILGLYNADNSIFDKLIVPPGMDKEVLIANIIRECSELEVLWTSPSSMKDMIGWWAKQEFDKWDKLWKTESLEFNVLENYDRYEESTTTDKGETHGTNSSRNGGSVEDVTRTNAFNSGEGTERESNTSTDTRTNNGKNDIQNSNENKVVSHIHGNIGVTTAVRMVSEYRSEFATFCTYEYITNEFKWNFCLCVY